MYTHAMALDRTLSSDILINFAQTTKEPDLFGVEVELEGMNIVSQHPNISQYWAQHPDNSLRVQKPNAQAIEYVFNQPYDLQDTRKAVDSLFTYLNRKDVEVFESYRTSIHVHLSCVMEKYRTIYNLMTLAVIFDELLVSQNGKHRIGNNFCLRTRDAHGQIEGVINSIQSSGSIWGLNGHNRYSSVNFVSLLKFGTIEFRSLECTADTDRLLHWIDTLDRLRTMARTYKDPQEIIQSFSLMSSREFLLHILGDCAVKYAKVDGWEQRLRHGMRLAQDLAYCSSWTAAAAQKEAAEKAAKMKPKKVNPFAHIEAWGGQPVHQGAIHPWPAPVQAEPLPADWWHPAIGDGN